MPFDFTLPLRGRVGAQLRGGVIVPRRNPDSRVELAERVTPTRRFAATSPLKGEVERAALAAMLHRWEVVRRPAATLPPCGGDVGGADRGG
jgi:hypothetical protein